MDTKFCIKNGRLILGDRIETDKSLFVVEGKIVAIKKKRDYLDKEFKAIDAKGLYVSPGFIDIHVHGIFTNKIDNLKADDLSEMCGRMAYAGVTGFLATTVSLPLDTLLKTASVIRSFLNVNRNTNLLGLHLEGPYINLLLSGAQNRKFIKRYKSGELSKIFSTADGLIRMMTFAPEIEGGAELLRYLVKRKVAPSIGHSNASYKEAEVAARKGAVHVTHLFNAMPSFHHRDSGLTGAALTLKDLSIDIIADGIHLNPATVKLAIKAKGPDKVILISDGISAGRDIKLGGLKVLIRNGQARLENGRLAGSLLGLNRAVKNVIEFADVDLSTAVMMASLNPARLLGIQKRKGSLEAGKDADIVIFDSGFNVKSTIINGNIIFNRIK